MEELKTVNVAVRVRPISEAEKSQGHVSVIDVVSTTNGDEIAVRDGVTTSSRFTYSYIFAQKTKQQELYDTAVVNLLEKLFEGFNVTVLAYGQTCSGKTYTMGTDYTGELNENTGVIPRAITDVFRIIGEREANAQVSTTVTCSFIELYQETVFDLLSKTRKLLDIREGSQGVILQGLTEIPVNSVQATLECLQAGTSGRCIGATAMNSTSSRSHAIFTISISMASSNDPHSVVKSKFHLVDLAGSERSKKTQATGDRFKEGVKINHGLLALGNVISMLAAANTSGNSLYVPYRDSKLTRLLKDSLGGNSYMLMIACVSPVDYNKDESLSTLRYADRACMIKNKPVVNIDPNRGYISQLQATIKELKEKILTLEGNGVYMVECPAGIIDEKNTIMPHDNMDAEHLLKLEEKNNKLQDQLQIMLQNLTSNEMRALVAEKALEEIERKLKPLQSNASAPDEENIAFIVETLASYREERSTLELPPNNSKEGPDAPELYDVQSSTVQQASDSHTEQQLRMHNELKELNSKLDLKEQLRRRCLGQGDAESSVVTVPVENLKTQLQEHENTIKTLEALLAEQSEQLENAKSSEKMLKLSEDRRRKVRQLESELTTARQKSLILQNQLKRREKEGLRVVDLTSEIKAMKIARVHLLRTMRTEHEKFRQWRQIQENQICQLKAKDRKRQYELKKMESKHSMQKQVLLRRMDIEKKQLQHKMNETIAVNRRLKAALDRRHHTPDGPGLDQSKLRGAEALRWIDQELELLHSAVEATETLKMLQKCRVEEEEELKHLKSTTNENDMQGENEHVMKQLRMERIAIFEESLRVRSETIVDLEQKLQSVNIEEQLTSFSDSLATLPEMRKAVRRLLDVLVQKDVTIMEFHNKKHAAQTPLADEGLLNKLKTIENILHDAQFWDQTQQYKLMQPPDSDLDSHSDEAMFETIKMILTNTYGMKQQSRARKTPIVKLEEEFEYDLYDENEWQEQESEIDLLRDPTFRATPMHKRRKTTSSHTSTLTATGSSSPCCSCTGFCSTKRCGCQKNGVPCSEMCKCPQECANMITIKQEPLSEPEEGEKENEPSSSKTENPTPSTRKRYITDELDILTYVKQNKKRKPLLDL